MAAPAAGIGPLHSAQARAPGDDEQAGGAVGRSAAGGSAWFVHHANAEHDSRDDHCEPPRFDAHWGTPDFLSTEVFKPLGLDMVLDPAHPVPTLAVSYTWEDGSYEAVRSAWEQTGDGSIQTTPGQLVIWADNYRTGAVGGPELLAAQVDGAVETGEETGERYGAGISIGTDGTLEYDGSWGGFLTYFAVSANRSHAVAVSCNTDHQDPTAIAGELAEIWLFRN